MRILLTVDPEIPVPPILYGGGERVAYGLLKAFVKRGHEVILVANAHSTALEASRIIAWKGTSSISKKDILTNASQLYKIYQEHKPDIVLSFSRLLYTYPLLLLEKDVKIVQRYGRFISNKSTGLASFIGKDKLHFTCVANHMLSHLKDVRKWKVIHNFADTDFYHPIENPKLNYFAFLGRIEPIKGPEDAIKAAIATENKLILAGNVLEEHQQYFENNIKPYFSNPFIEYIGAVDDRQKKEFLQNAKALLFPLRFKEEAFSNVVAESLACGTPVIGYNKSFVPEAIKNNINGYIVNDLEQMIEYIPKIEKISRSDVRQDSLSNFSQNVIAEHYVNYFKKIIG